MCIDRDATLESILSWALVLSGLATTISGMPEESLAGFCQALTLATPILLR
jgi:hypothetical protein